MDRLKGMKMPTLEKLLCVSGPSCCILEGRQLNRTRVDPAHRAGGMDRPVRRLEGRGGGKKRAVLVVMVMSSVLTLVEGARHGLDVAAATSELIPCVEHQHGRIRALV